ncbi:DUF190 domain-containing protein [Sporolactobacillus sp. KGMB 08714]|uniref:DUF190 domain-containing protein n=1 Tax=Sporolactobacillus sp. KGMB 08714 TaxID=3064704 RepID=UPI002FBE0DFC
MQSLLRIVIGEMAETEGSQRFSQWLQHFLWEKGFPGLTIRRGKMNLDHQGMPHISILEDQLFNDLALIIETVADNEQIKAIVPEIQRRMKHGQMSLTRGMEERDLNEHRYFAVKVYTKEENSWFRKGEYDKVFSFFQEKEAMWISMTEGIIGYGKDRIIHRQKLFTLSEKMPIVIESVVSSDHLKKLLNGLADVVEEGAVFTTPIHLIVNK